MDTPLNPSKGPRRKLKRVLKKTKYASGTNHNSSLHQLYQKKVRSAINVSLNLSTNIRTLQANNRALAVKCERLQEELRLALNLHTNLQEHNQSLNERILELERQIDISPSIIEHEVNRRYQAKLQDLQTKLSLLTANACEFTKDLNELHDQCVITPRKSRGSTKGSVTDEDQSSSRSLAGFNYMANSELRNPLTKHGGQICDVRSEGHTGSPDHLNQGYMQEMSVLLEASVIGDQITSGLPFSQKQEKRHLPSQKIGRGTSRLPRRKPVCMFEAGDAEENESSHQAEKLSYLAFPVTKRRSSKRRSESSLGNVLTTDQSPLHNTNHNVDNNILSSEQLNIGSWKETSMTEGNKQVNNRKEESSFGDQTKASGLVLNSGKVTDKEVPRDRKRDLFPVAKSPPLFIRNEFELLNAHKQWMEKTGAKVKDADRELCPNSHFQEIPSPEHTTYMDQDMEFTVTISGNTQSIQCPTSPSPPSWGVQGMVGQLPTANQEQPPKHCEPTLETEENPLSSVPSMSGNLSVSPAIEENTNCNKTNRNEVETFVSVRSRSHHGNEKVNIDSETGGTDDGSSQDVASVPDAVKVHVSKGGKLLFAAGRKCADGSRPNTTAPVRTRTKPKKFKLDETQKEEEGAAKTIFDFHDKTPECLFQQQNLRSVYSFSADESTLLLQTPPGKFRQKRKIEAGSKNNPCSINESSGAGAEMNVAQENDFFSSDNMKISADTDGRTLASSQGRHKSKERKASKGKPKSKPVIEGIIDTDSQTIGIGNDCPPMTEMQVCQSKAVSTEVKNNYMSDNTKTYVGDVYSAPLKDSPQGSKLKYRTCSRSRGSKRNDNNDGESASESVKKVRSKSRGRSRNKERNDLDEGSNENLSETLNNFSNVHTKIQTSDTNLNDDIFPKANKMSTFVGEVYSVPLEDSPQASKQKYRTRSQSRGRQRKISDERDPSPENSKNVRSKSRGRSRHKERRNYEEDTNRNLCETEIDDPKKYSKSQILKDGTSPIASKVSSLVGKVYNVPLKDSPQATKSNLRTRSQSRGRPQKVGGSPLESAKKIKSRSTTQEKFVLKGESDKGSLEPGMDEKTNSPNEDIESLSSEPNLNGFVEKLDGEVYIAPLKESPGASKPKPGSSSQSRGRQTIRNKSASSPTSPNKVSSKSRGRPNAKTSADNRIFDNDNNSEASAVDVEFSGGKEAFKSGMSETNFLSSHSEKKDSSYGILGEVYSAPLNNSPQVNKLNRRTRSKSSGRQKRNDEMKGISPKSAKLVGSKSTTCITLDQGEKDETEIVPSELMATLVSQRGVDEQVSEEKAQREKEIKFNDQSIQKEKEQDKDIMKERALENKDVLEIDNSAPLFKGQSSSDCPDFGFSKVKKANLGRQREKQHEEEFSGLKGGNTPTSPKRKRYQADDKRKKHAKSEEVSQVLSKSPKSSLDAEAESLMEKAENKNEATADPCSSSDDRVGRVRTLNCDMTDILRGQQKVTDPVDNVSKSRYGSPATKMSKISNIGESSGTLLKFNTDLESLSINHPLGERKRRAALQINYAPLPLNSKLRRGDPFTSHYASEKISIFKSPKSKAKQKAKIRRDVLGTLSNMAIKEEDPSKGTND